MYSLRTKRAMNLLLEIVYFLSQIALETKLREFGADFVSVVNPWAKSLVKHSFSKAVLEVLAKK